MENHKDQQYMALRLPKKDHWAFKVACANQGMRMTDVLKDCIYRYTQDFFPDSLNKDNAPPTTNNK